MVKPTMADKVLDKVYVNAEGGAESQGIDCHRPMGRADS